MKLESQCYPHTVWSYCFTLLYSHISYYEQLKRPWSHHVQQPEMDLQHLKPGQSPTAAELKELQHVVQDCTACSYAGKSPIYTRAGISIYTDYTETLEDSPQ